VGPGGHDQRAAGHGLVFDDPSGKNLHAAEIVHHLALHRTLHEFLSETEAEHERSRPHKDSQGGLKQGRHLQT
jgi:hypothetical protein